MTTHEAECLVWSLGQPARDAPYHPYGRFPERDTELPPEFEGANQELWTAASMARDCVHMLVKAGQFGGVRDRRVAYHMLAAIIREAVIPYSGRVVAQPIMFELLGRPEALLRRMRRLVERPGAPSWLRAAWPVIGMLMSAAAVGMILVGAFVPAALLIVARITISASLPTPGVVSETDRARDHQRDWGLNWSRCVIGHFVDSLMTSAIAANLLMNGHQTWGVICLIIPLLVLTSTLLRLAAAQVGVVLGRLYAERIARNGMLVVGLVVAGLAPGQEASSVPPILLAAVGAALYAGLEIVRTITYVRRREIVERQLSTDEAFGSRVANVVPLVESYSSAPVDEMLRRGPEPDGLRRMA